MGRNATTPANPRIPRGRNTYVAAGIQGRRTSPLGCRFLVALGRVLGLGPVSLAP